MARSRNIKPGFFSNEILAEIEPLGRLLFAALWTVADREGRLQDRPKKIKAQCLPYDECDCDALLWTLHKAGFIVRYAVDDDRFIQVAKWDKHQNPHKNEADSVIPPFEHETSTVQVPGKHHTSTVQSTANDGTAPACSLIPDSLIPCSLIPDSLKTPSSTPRRLAAGEHREQFERFWSAYPRKVGKTTAFKAWEKLKPSPALVDEILAAVEAQKLGEQWLKDGGQFIPHPSTWLNGQRWTDEVTPYVARPVVRRESELDRSRREAFEKLTGRNRNASDNGDYIDV